jgi:excisionase family DNA binding protein
MNVVHELDEPLATTVPGAAKALGVGVTKIKSEIAAGKLAARKIGSRTVVPVESLKTYLQNREAA